ncbi:MAG: hypothetical protein SD837_13175 [Candidatus Electrothrix scaldis]|nr:MAG: hypothetical protein SD837_13175 [Candidatus Electrothrix sp. GW3-3]
MKELIRNTLIASFVLLSTSLFQSRASAETGDIISSFNVSAGWNVVGLTWVNGYLWAVDHGGYSPFSLRQLDIENGTIMRNITINSITDVMGAAWDGNYFWVVSHHTGLVSQIDIDGNIISSFQGPNLNTDEAGQEGLTWDGQYLWLADSDFDMIYQLTTDGTIVHSFPSPASEPQGLAWDGTYLWHFDNAVDQVYKLDPVDGTVLLSFPAPGNGEGDLAWHDGDLWLSRNSVSTIYQIEAGAQDADYDGVLDDDDLCPDTEFDFIVDSDGCSIDQLCSCEGPRETTNAWKNHGKFVSCTSKAAEDFVEQGLITEEEKDATVSEAAQLDCGKKNK